MTDTIIIGYGGLLIAVLTLLYAIRQDQKLNKQKESEKELYLQQQFNDLSSLIMQNETFIKGRVKLVEAKTENLETALDDVKTALRDHVNRKEH